MRYCLRYLLYPLFFLSIAARAQVDTAIGVEPLSSLGNDHRAMASALCLDLPGERQKANAIYNWVTHYIAYDVKALSKLPDAHDDEALYALKNRKAVCVGYANLFVQLCRDAGLKACVIDGYAKDWIFDDGDEVHIPRHSWAAVRIDGKWQLVDPTWGAGGLRQEPTRLRKIIDKITFRKTLYGKKMRFHFDYDTTYFAQDPETFRLKHLPADPLWQLTDSVMPVTVFEAGDSAVKQFNTCCSKPRQADPRLDRIAELNETQRTYEYAERAYAYNQRFQVILALKNSIRAKSVVDKIVKDTTVENPDIMLRDALNTMKTSIGYVKEQKKAFPAEYARLKKKNREKATETRQYIGKIRATDKKLAAQCKRYIRTADSKQARTKKQVDKLLARRKQVDAGNLEDIATGKITKKESSPELMAIKDSATDRGARAEGHMKMVTAAAAELRTMMLGSIQLLDSLGRSLTAEDSMLRSEAMERLNMHDSYDDEVKQWNRLFREQKYGVTDSLMTTYFEAFDTIAARSERISKTYEMIVADYGKNLKGLEQYKKWNNGGGWLPDAYAKAVQDYYVATDSTAGHMRTYGSYLKANGQLFGMLVKLCDRQIRIAEFMDKVEKSRQALETRSIDKKKAMDVQENERQRTNTQRAINMLQKAVNEVDRR